MERAVLLKQEDILEAIKKYFDDDVLEINLNDEEILKRIGYICVGDAVPYDYNVFPII